ncbi:hypothetical protein Sjap_022588 [Stephania japonica]|uniref:Uncharacterized protein n=1 Tax=Stephania japonica TaxID=461633 RepID=A0AAP0EPP1_9MAGN
MPSAKSTSKDLLKLEHERSAFSALESTVLVCKKEMLPEFPRYQSDGKLVTTSVPTSNVLGKVKDFLGVMAESNKKLQDNAVNSDEYDIEVLNGNENEYIEMDLLLGVSDLHTPEAVAAAESAISGPHTIVDFAVASSDSDTEDSDSSSDDDDDDDDDEDTDNDDWVQTSSRKLQRSCSSGGDQAKKRLKIQEL